MHHRQSFGNLQPTALFLSHGIFVMMPGPPFKRWHCYRVRRTFSRGTADTFVIGDILIYVGWDYHSLDRLTCHSFKREENGQRRQLRVKDGEFFHPQLFFEEVRGVAWPTIAGAYLKARQPKDKRA